MYHIDYWSFSSFVVLQMQARLFSGQGAHDEVSSVRPGTCPCTQGHRFQTQNIARDGIGRQIAHIVTTKTSKHQNECNSEIRRTARKTPIHAWREAGTSPKPKTKKLEHLT